MAYSPSEKYPGAVDVDPDYQGGKFRDNNPSTTNNGSPLKAIDRNELLARDEAIMNDAGFEYNGVADTPQDSQLFKAYKASLGNGANLLSNHNFLIQTPDDSQPLPDATPRSYPPGYQIFSGVFANETTGITNLTYIDGRVSFSGGDLYFAVPNTNGLERVTDFVASVADFDGKPRTRGVSFALVGDEYRVTVGIDALEDESAVLTPLGSVKFEQGGVATGHTVGANVRDLEDSSTRKFDILQSAVESDLIREGMALNIKDRILGDGGTAIWDVVLTSTVTPNGYDIVQSTANPSLSLVYRIKDSIDAVAYGIDVQSTSDQTTILESAIAKADELGVYLNIGSGAVYANAETTGINVRISGEGKIVPFSKAAIGLRCIGGFDAALSITDIATVTEVVNTLHGAITVSKLTVPGHSYTMGDIVKVVSEDLIPSVLVGDGTRNGEWATVYSVSGNFVYLGIVLKNTYITTPRIAKLLDFTADVDLTFDGLESNTPAKALCQFVAFNKPRLNLTMKRNGGIGCLLTSNYNPITTYSAIDMRDDPGNAQFGYGLDDIGNAFAVFLNPYGRQCRHVYTTGTGGSVATDIYEYGESYRSYIHAGVGEDCTNTVWDTHSQGDGIKFSSCQASGSRASFVARCKNVEWDHCSYDDTNVGFRCLNVTAVNFVKATANKCSGKNADIPISIVSQGGGASEMIINGGEFEFRMVTVPFSLNTGTLSIRDRAIFRCTDSSSSNTLAQIVDVNVIIESAVIDMGNTDMTAENYIQLNGSSSFQVTDEFRLPTLGATGNLFFTTDGGNTASIDIDKIITKDFIKARQAVGINGEVILTLVDTATEQSSSGYQSISIGATDSVTYTLSRDDNIYIRLTTAGAGSTPSTIPDGVFAGQQICYHNNVGGTLTISSGLSNVLVGAIINVGEAKIATWQPAGWVFT